jgi:hypothetical protein
MAQTVEVTLTTVARPYCANVREPVVAVPARRSVSVVMLIVWLLPLLLKEKLKSVAAPTPLKSIPAELPELTVTFRAAPL